MYQIFLLLAHSEILSLAIGLHAWHEGSEWNLEERMYGLAAGIDGCHARRSKNHHTLRRPLAKPLQECCLASTRLASEKHRDAGALKVLPGKVHFVILLH